MPDGARPEEANGEGTGKTQPEETNGEETRKTRLKEAKRKKAGESWADRGFGASFTGHRSF